MNILQRCLFFVYNLLMVIVSAAAAAAALGRPEPVSYINLALSTPQNRLAVGLVATIFLVLALIVLLTNFKIEAKTNSIVVDSTLAGDISITIPAIKAIIVKALRKIEGVKETTSVINNSPEGLIVYLHMMINPDYSVPEMSKSIQTVVKQYLENTGGLKVAEVKILVDDMNVSSKKAGT